MLKGLQPLIIVVFLFNSGFIKASHGWFIDVRYEYIGDSTGNPLDYMVYWRMIDPITPPLSSFQFEVHAPCFSTINVTALPYYDPGDSILASGKVYLDDLFNCASQVDVGDSLSLMKFKAVVTLPDSCNDILFINSNVFYGIIRGDNVSSTSTGSASYVATATLNNSNGPNSSPVFQTQMAQTTCPDVIFNYSQSAIDEDGDSLYYWYHDRSDWANGYNLLKPFPSSRPIIWDSSTGRMILQPDTSGRFVLTVSIEEHRYDSLSSSYYKISVTERNTILYVTDTCRFKAKNLSPLIAHNPNCGTDSIVITLASPIKSNTLSIGEFRLFRRSSIVTIPVVSVDTSNSFMGYSNRIVLKLHQAITYNDSFALVTYKGFDGNTIKNICGQWIPENLELRFSVTNCDESLDHSIDESHSPFYLYPTISREKIKINLGDLGISSVTEFSISNNSGQSIRRWQHKTQESRELEIDVQDLPNGIYFLQISNSSFTSIERFFKI